MHGGGGERVHGGGGERVHGEQLLTLISEPRNTRLALQSDIPSGSRDCLQSTQLFRFVKPQRRS